MCPNNTFITERPHITLRSFFRNSFLCEVYRFRFQSTTITTLLRNRRNCLSNFFGEGTSLAQFAKNIGNIDKDFDIRKARNVFLKEQVKCTLTSLKFDYSSFQRKGTSEMMGYFHLQNIK